MPIKEAQPEQAWSPPTWDQVAPRFQEAFPDIEPDEIRRRYESARELGQQRYRLRNAEETNWTAFLRSTDPFGVLAGRNASALRQASERFAQGRAEPGDAETIAVQERLQELDQNRSTGSSVGRTILGAGTVAAEYLTGSRVLRAASGASVLGRVAQSGMVGRAAALAAPRVWSATEQRRAPEIQRDEEGRAVGLPTAETSRTFWNALPAGSFDAFTEAFTEQLGGTRAFRAVGRAPGALMERIGLGNVNRFINAGVSRHLERAGVHGVLAEMGEERAGELMRGLVLGDLMGERDTYGATGQLAGAARSAVRGEGQAAQRQAGQALRQLFIEGAAFSIIQGGARGLGSIMNARSGPEAILRTQIEAEVQRQRASQPTRTDTDGQPPASTSARRYIWPIQAQQPDPDLAAAEAQINQRLAALDTEQTRMQVEGRNAQRRVEAPQAPATEPVPAEAQTPVQAPQAQPASEPARPEPRRQITPDVGRQVINASELTFAEIRQKRKDLERVRRQLPPGSKYPPIVAIERPGGLEVLDGHHRGRVAEERGDSIPAFVISERMFNTLKDKGFTFQEIATGVLLMAGETRQVRRIDRRLGTRGRGIEVAKILQESDPARQARQAPADTAGPPLAELQDIAAALGVSGWRGLSREALVERLGGRRFLEALEASNAPKQSPVERRQDLTRRRRVAEMTPEERAQELLTSELTRLPNRRAFDEADPAPAVAMSDADGLKAFNDRFGYDAGNALLKAKAEALRAVGLDAYHEKGDEFLYRGATAAEIGQKLEQARSLLRESVIEVSMTDGSVKRFKGADFSYGVGNALQESETALKKHKAERETRGERARGELRGIVEVGPQEGEGGAGVAAQAERAKKGLAALKRGGKRLGEKVKAIAQATKGIQPGVKEFETPPAETRVALTPQEEIGLAWYRTGEEGGLREIAEAHGVSHETPRNWAKAALNKLGLTYENVKEQEAIGRASRLSDAQEILAAAERGEATWVDDDKAPLPPLIAESGMSPEELIELAKARVRKHSDYTEKQEALQNKIMKEIERAKRAGRVVSQKRVEAYAAELAELESQASGSSGEEGGQPGEVSGEAQEDFGRPISQGERAAGSISGGQEDAASATRSPRVTALANVVTKAERAANELPPIEQAARLEDAAVWDEAMERLREDPLAAVRLVEELNKKPRSTTVQENALLAHWRVSLANEHERASLAYIAEFRKLKRADPAKLNELEVRERWLKDQVDQSDRAIVKAGTEWGRSGRWRRMLIAEDFTLSGMLLRAEAAKGRPLTPKEKNEILELNRKIAELQKQLDQAIKEGKAKPGAASDFDYEVAKVKALFEKKLRADREAREPWKVKAMRLAGEATSIPKSLMAMIDLPLGRQGWISAITHPIRTAKAIPESLRALFSEDAANRSVYNIYHRPNAKLYEASGLEITDATGPLSNREEGFFSRFIGKMPVLGAIGRASNRIHQTMMNRIRVDAFDAMVADLARGDGEITTSELKVLANYANVMTGRGHLGETGEKAIVLLNATFFAPKYVASRFQMVLGQPLWTFQAGLSPRARLLVAKEYGRLLAAFGTALGLAIAAGWDFEKDLRSTDFGKVRMGNTRIDVTGGLANAGTFLARMAGGVKTQGGTVRPADAGDVGRFVRGKLAPLPAAAIDLRTGKNVVGERVSPAYVGLKSTTPLFVHDVIEAVQQQGVPKGTAIALLALMGMSTQTYGRR